MINFYYEIGSLKPELDTIFNDMCANDEDTRVQGFWAAEGLVDKMRLLALLHSGESFNAINAQTPQGEDLLERLKVT